MGRRLSARQIRKRALDRYYARHRNDPAYMERMRLRSAEWRRQNAERNARVKKEWYEEHKEALSLERKLTYVPHPRVLLTEEQKAENRKLTQGKYQEANREKINARNRERWKNPEAKRKWKEARDRRLKEDPEFLLRHRLRTRMRHALKGELKAASTMELVGCSSADLKNHIESHWTDGMSWSNYGWGEGKWQIDHIRPLASFNLADPEQQRQAFHFTNLSPEWWTVNSAKSSKWNGKNHRCQNRTVDERVPAA